MEIRNTLQMLAIVLDIRSYGLSWIFHEDPFKRFLEGR